MGRPNKLLNIKDSASVNMELTPSAGTVNGETSSESSDKMTEVSNSYKEYSEKNTASIEKSRITNLTSLSAAETLLTDLPINQVDDNHYIYRRGSTQVHVQTFSESLAGDVIEHSEEREKLFDGLKLISAIMAMIILIITLVLKLSAAITPRVSTSVEEQYMLSLYALAFLSTTYYNIKGMCRHQLQIKFLKGNQSSNRWLKGVIVLFSLAIVLKDGLEFISFLMVDDISHCPNNQLAAAIAMIHAVFVITQVKYIFRFSKVFMQNCSSGSRTSVMFLIATNLSVWIAAVVDETLIALNKGSSAAEHVTTTTTFPNSTHLAKSGYADTEHDEHDTDVCSCHNDFCTTVHIAETFLFPFLIEFSLVASSLLYITWTNIGKRPPPCEGVTKPSYKFHGQYTGVAMGGVGFFVCVVFMILLGTSGSDVPESEKDYFSEHRQLVLYDSFMIGIESCMVIAIFLGFYLFYRIRRPLEESELLDNVLLIVCIMGPIAVNTFSLIAVIVGPDNRLPAWPLTVFDPLIDTLQCIFQLVFILYGLKREPVTSANSKETAAQLRFGIHQYIKRSNGEEDSSASGFDNKTFLRSRRNSITSVVSRLANPHPPALGSELCSERKLPVIKDDPKSMAPPQIVVTTESEKEVVQSNKDGATGPKQKPESVVEVPKQSILKIVSETSVARPDTLRHRLRDVIMFLLVTNACLWVFTSLDGTAFVVYPYQSTFYGASAWTTINMITRPLAIFFRMHSAGCLFEMWSFA